MPVIRGDQQRLSQVLVNLLANANKFAPPDSVIRIGARAHRDGDGLVFWVEDEGVAAPGIEDARLFDQFRRVGRRTRTATRAGSAWGCSSCARSSSGTAATVRLERTAQGGTRATVELPQDAPA